MKARLDWRQHMVVSFCLRASPQVTVTVACTHTRVGDNLQTITGKPEQTARKKGIIAMRALQRVLENHHRPLLAAGYAKHLTIFVGDWNITEENMRDRAVQATGSSFSMGVGSTSLCAKGTHQRDLAVVFADDQHWEATRDDTIPKSTMKALDRSIGEHHPFFFYVTASFNVADVPEPSEQAKSPPPATPQDFVIAEKVRFESAMPAEERRTVNASLVPLSLVIWGIFERSHPRRG